VAEQRVLEPVLPEKKKTLWSLGVVAETTRSRQPCRTAPRSARSSTSSSMPNTGQDTVGPHRLHKNSIASPWRRQPSRMPRCVGVTRHLGGTAELRRRHLSRVEPRGAVHLAAGKRGEFLQLAADCVAEAGRQPPRRTEDHRSRGVHEEAPSEVPSRSPTTRIRGRGRQHESGSRSHQLLHLGDLLAHSRR